MPQPRMPTRKSRSVLRYTLVNQNRERGILSALGVAASALLADTTRLLCGGRDWTALRGLAAVIVAQKDILQARLVGGEVDGAIRHRHTQDLAKFALHREARDTAAIRALGRRHAWQRFERVYWRESSEDDLHLVVAQVSERADI